MGVERISDGGNGENPAVQGGGLTEMQTHVPRQECSGVVSDWNPKGFGFAMFEDGRRAYIHNSQCGGEHLSVGEGILAQLAPDERSPGKWQAVNITRTGTLDDTPSEKR